MTKTIAKFIDHTLLNHDATKEDIDMLIEEAIEHQFYSVCVNPHWVSYCYKRLKDTDVKVCTVIGFPLGATVTKVKAYEAIKAVQDGATEIDMVINVGELKSKNDDFVQSDIESVVDAVDGKALVKVIIETSLLTKDEKVRACQIARDANADFVKTSTGFSGGGATAEDIALMHRVIGNDMGIKASGGIRNKDIANQMIQAGATRIGASSSIIMIKEYHYFSCRLIYR